MDEIFYLDSIFISLYSTGIYNMDTDETPIIILIENNLSWRRAVIVPFIATLVKMTMSSRWFHFLTLPALEMQFKISSDLGIVIISA